MTTASAHRGATRRLGTSLLGALLAAAVAASPASAQPLQLPAARSTAAAAQAQEASDDIESREPDGARRFLRDVGSDFKHFFSIDTAEWLGVGGAAALAVHPADDELRDETQKPGESTTLGGGAQYGAFYVQVPLAVAWWAIGHSKGSENGASAGRDLLRAQISAGSWTYALKYATNRTRPNGDPRSFPSGHASATFATATVLEQHCGWKLGLPAFAAATYTGISRITDNKHWASDVVFGAFIGVASGRTVTLRLRSEKVALAPWAVPGGFGLLLSAGG